MNLINWLLNHCGSCKVKWSEPVLIDSPPYKMHIGRRSPTYVTVYKQTREDTGEIKYHVKYGKSKYPINKTAFETQGRLMVD